MLHTDLIAYIKDATVRGHDRKDIEATLASAGWTMEVIAAHLAVAVDVKPPKAVPRPEVVTIKSDAGFPGIITTLGVTLIGIGAFAFVASYWQYLDDALKVLILAIATVLSFGVGAYLQFKGSAPASARAMVVLACILYGATLFMVHQMLDIKGHVADMFLLWAVGTAFVAELLDRHSLRIFAFAVTGFGAILMPFTIADSGIEDPYRGTQILIIALAIGSAGYAAWRSSARTPDQARTL